VPGWPLFVPEFEAQVREIVAQGRFPIMAAVPACSD
jgi:hypothetical protein